MGPPSPGLGLKGLGLVVPLPLVLSLSESFPLPTKFFSAGCLFLHFFFHSFPELFYFLLGSSFFFKATAGFLAKIDSLFAYISVFFLHVFCLFFFYSSLFAITALTDLFVVDYPGHRRGRFETNYLFLSHYQNMRFFFKLFVTLYALVPSIGFFFPSSQ